MHFSAMYSLGHANTVGTVRTSQPSIWLSGTLCGIPKPVSAGSW